MSDGAVASCPRAVYDGTHQAEDQSLQSGRRQGRRRRPIQVLGIGRVLGAVIDAFPELAENRTGEQSAGNTGRDRQRRIQRLGGLAHAVVLLIRSKRVLAGGSAVMWLG